MSFIESGFHLDAVVFDLDGTLIDSADAYLRLINTAFVRIDLPPIVREVAVDALRYGRFDWDRVIPEGLKGQKDIIIQRTKAIMREIHPQGFREDLRLIPGVPSTLKDIADRGLRIALVTSSKRVFIEDKLYPLRKAGLDTLFEVIITTDDTKEMKPSPEPLLECGRRLGIALNRMVYVGDSRIDIRAGRAAGTMTIGVLTGADDYPALKAEEPDAILESVADLQNILVAQKITQVL